jgi:hypothetical protein
MYFVINKSNEKGSIKASGFEVIELGILLWNDSEVLFKKSSINQVYLSYEWNKNFLNKGNQCFNIQFT